MPRRMIMPLALAVVLGIGGLGLAQEEGPDDAATVLPPELQPLPDRSQDLCVPDYASLAAKLQATYAEEPVSAGLGQDGNLVSIFASGDTGTWTMVMTRPEGTSCVVAVGEAWQTRPQAGGPRA